MKLQTAKSILAYSKRYLDLSGLRIAYGTDWFYSTTEKAISIQREDHRDEDQEIWWDRFMFTYLKEEFNYEMKQTIECTELFSLFHEVGHFLIGCICTPYEYHIRMQDADTDEEYRKIPDEYEADKFAVEFLKEHMDELLELIESLQ
jgi:Zn-dependent peptidase ImmA (M78 family)